MGTRGVLECEGGGSDGCTSSCSRAVATGVCMSKCQEWDRLESRGQRQRQGSASPAAGEIHLPCMCMCYLLLPVQTHPDASERRQLVLPLFLGVPCVLYLCGHQCITLYCTWHLAVSLPETRAHLLLQRPGTKLDWDGPGSY